MPCGDTSVLLADPGALKRFAEHEVVLPVVVIFLFAQRFFIEGVTVGGVKG